MEEFEITFIKNGTKSIKTDLLTEEVPLTIELNGKEIVTLLSSPTDLKELVYGFLYTSGFIGNAADIKGITINEKKWIAYIETETTNISDEMIFKRVYTTGCGKGVLYYNPLDLIKRMKLDSTFKIENSKIISSMREFQKSSEEFQKTGAVHSAALCEQEKIIILKDDIGRHNAIDKIIGKAIIEGVNFDDKVILTSGRISSEILLKTNKCKIPVIASAGAPTNQAVKISRDLNVTLVGFVRGSRMNIYSGIERVL